MAEVWFPGVAALVITAGAAPIVRWLLLRRRVLDVPNSRSSHSVPVARGGGIACLFGLIGGSAVGQVVGLAVPWPVLGAGFVLALVGFADDRLDLPASPRLGSQLVAGAVLGWSLDGPRGAAVGSITMAVVVNVVNFMDGINGITALSITVSGLTTVFAAGASGLQSLALLGALTAGSALGFLPWNAPRASIFLGDVGSYLFGALVTGALLLGVTEGARPQVLAAPLALYLLDTSVAILRRSAQREPLTVAHREHVYQRLVDTYAVPHVTVSIGVALLAGLVVVAWSSLGTWAATVVTGVVGGLYLGSVRILRGLLPLRAPNTKGLA